MALVHAAPSHTPVSKDGEYVGRRCTGDSHTVSSIECFGGIGYLHTPLCSSHVGNIEYTPCCSSQICIDYTKCCSSLVGIE